MQRGSCSPRAEQSPARLSRLPARHPPVGVLSGVGEAEGPGDTHAEDQVQDGKWLGAEAAGHVVVLWKTAVMGKGPGPGPTLPLVPPHLLSAPWGRCTSPLSPRLPPRPCLGGPCAPAPWRRAGAGRGQAAATFQGSASEWLKTAASAEASGDSRYWRESGVSAGRVPRGHRSAIRTAVAFPQHMRVGKGPAPA